MKFTYPSQAPAAVLLHLEPPDIPGIGRCPLHNPAGKSEAYFTSEGTITCISDGEHMEIWQEQMPGCPDWTRAANSFHRPVFGHKKTTRKIRRLTYSLRGLACIVLINEMGGTAAKSSSGSSSDDEKAKTGIITKRILYVVLPALPVTAI